MAKSSVLSIFVLSDRAITIIASVLRQIKSTFNIGYSLALAFDI